MMVTEYRIWQFHGQSLSIMFDELIDFENLFNNGFDCCYHGILVVGKSRQDATERVYKSLKKLDKNLSLNIDFESIEEELKNFIYKAIDKRSQSLLTVRGWHGLEDIFEFE